MGALTENIVTWQRLYEHKQFSTFLFRTSHGAFIKRGQIEIVGVDRGICRGDPTTLRLTPAAAAFDHYRPHR